MGAVTYPDKNVIEFINSSMIPLQVQYDAQPLATDFNLKWTPTLITLDAEGKEHYRIIGFLPPEELIPSLFLGIAKIHFDKGEFKEAIPNLDMIVSEFPGSGVAPEAMYLRGVCRYESTLDGSWLGKLREELISNYPDSIWAKRTDPFGG